MVEEYELFSGSVRIFHGPRVSTVMNTVMPRPCWTGYRGGYRGELRVAHGGADGRRPRFSGYGKNRSGGHPDHSRVFSARIIEQIINVSMP